MPRSENPLQRVARLWTDPDSQFMNSDVRLLNPDLGEALDALVAMAGHLMTDPASVSVPPLARIAPGSGSRTVSAARMDLGAPTLHRAEKTGLEWQDVSLLEGLEP
jgi:hypothetical protein